MRDRLPEPLLHDPRFEHDACGVGFVADAGGQNRGRVLRLALDGLAALGHRGAFAADGESSDGAGIALPLEPALLGRLGAPAADLVAVVVLFLPAASSASARGREVCRLALAEEGLDPVARREVPLDPDVLGREARVSLPRVEHVFVTARHRCSATEFERKLVAARRRMEQQGREAGLGGFSVVSASSRTIVYKGLVAGGRLAAFYPDLADPLPISYAVFHQRYATNTRPTWSLAQPFGFIAHNGEINTVRGNREEWRGRRATLGGSWGERVAAIGPLLSEDGSDSRSLDDAVELLVSAGSSVAEALLRLIPESLALRTHPHHAVHELQARIAGTFAPWDGPAALCFHDGQHVGALLDRNGLRPAAYTITHDRLVGVASEAGAVRLDAAETAARGRLGPGEMLLVDVRGGAVWLDAEAKTAALRTSPPLLAEPVIFTDSTTLEPTASATDAATRWLHGLDAERIRLSIRTMALEGQEPTWSMGDDTPLAGLGRVDRPVADHLRQSFAQVTNPAIDPDRERIVMEMRVTLGRRARPLAPLPRSARSLRLPRPVVADLRGLLGALEALERKGAGGRNRVRTLDATWVASDGSRGLERALERLVREALAASRANVALLVVSDRTASLERPPVPSVLAVGAIHTALADAGRRGATDIVAEAGDVHDVHAAAMSLASGATAVVPWLALELAAELAGARGSETVTASEARSNLLAAYDKGLRKVLARMGISCAASYIGGHFFEVLELDREVSRRCFPAAPTWPGSVCFEEIARRQLRRIATAASLARPDRLPDPGFARYRADGERHLYAPPVVKAVQALGAADDPAAALSEYRSALEREPAVVRDQLRLRPAARSLPVAAVEPAEAIMRRFVGAAMSLGSLSPEAHQAIALGMRRIGGSSNTGEGGEDPAWYDDAGGTRRDSGIKQVASGRFGVTAEYLARAEQLEIKIAQGSKPGEGGQLPGRKATPLIAALRRGRAGQSMISPPPHHDIYSIEDLAQLIADLRAIDPVARIGVKLVAALGVGTIAAGVVKAGADYVQISGHAGGTGASPLSSIKHAGIPWELGVAETHQVLMRNDLRDRVALRTDGGLQTGRDVIIAALLGAEEFGFGTAALVALGCDMARQCHLDTCPTGIATQREDLRAKFTGTPEAIERFFRAIAEDVRSELAVLGFPTLGDAIGRSDRLAADPERATLDLTRLVQAPAWDVAAARRAQPAHASSTIPRAPASPTEIRILDPGRRGAATERPVLVTTADRSFGARLSGELERAGVDGTVRWDVGGEAGQSFGAFLTRGVELRLVGQANDYVGKGLSGGTLVIEPEPVLHERAADLAVCGNTCLYGATSGRVHVVGRAGMRFAVRNSGAEAVVEGVGPHGCEYMTAGVVVILGAAGRNLCAGMTGGRVYLHDPTGVAIGAVDPASARSRRLSWTPNGDGHVSDAEPAAELLALLAAHRDVGSVLAGHILAQPDPLERFWLIESLLDVTAPPNHAVEVGGAPPVPRPAVPAGQPGARTPEPA